VIVSDSPLLPDRDAWRDTLLRYRIDGRPVIHPGRDDHQAELDSILSLIDTMADDTPAFDAMELRSSILRRTEEVELIRDDNMGTEWDLAPR
jgi:hypothetical protein